MMKHQLKYYVGSLLDQFAPVLAREVDAGLLDGKNAKLKEFISDSRARRSARTGNAAELRQRLAVYWQSSRGDAFYDAYPERFEDWFLGEHYVVVEKMAALLEARPVFHRLIEVGCGDGRVLEHLSERFPRFTSVMGIDLNENIIRRNREVYLGTRLKFESGDLHQWLGKYHGSGIVLLSYGGVLEYLTQAELEELFVSFKAMASPAMIVLVEPVALDFDMQTETTSRPYGVEHSFSHPHRHLLEKAGWKIEFEEAKMMDHRWMLMIATA